jgi:DNA (cytosine-5)-methyltransferase 1
MRGGNREGAGRKVIPASKKKQSKNIYLTEALLNQVHALEVDNCSSFSQKAVELISIGLRTLQATRLEDDINVSQSNGLNEKIKAEAGMSCNNQEQQPKKRVEETLKFIDLFAGIGGIRKGFEDEHTKCVFSSEWDRYAAKTYEANYGEKPAGDITKINERDIPDYDVLLAGFPCQPFSNIGKREGFGHATQGTLFFDVLRILKAKRPKMFLLENVKGLLTNDNGHTFKVIIDYLKKLNYSIFYQVLDAQNFGLPQKRERVIIVGFRADLKIKEFNFPLGNPNQRVPIKSILEQSSSGYTISEHLQKNYLFKKDDGRPQLVDFDSEEQVKTLVASYHKIQRLTGTFVKDGATGIRLFTQLEAKRLMGFPDDFIMPVSRTQMYRQLGNSVAVPMIKAVADVMKVTLKRAEILQNKDTKVMIEQGQTSYNKSSVESEVHF